MDSLLSRRNLDFLLYEWLDVEALTARDRYRDHSRETFDAVLELSEAIATEQFAPHRKRNDTEHQSHRPRGTRRRRSGTAVRARFRLRPTQCCSCG